MSVKKKFYKVTFKRGNIKVSEAVLDEMELKIAQKLVELLKDPKIRIEYQELTSYP